MFRILGSVDVLNEKMGVNLTHHDVNWVYSCQRNNEAGYYLKPRVPTIRLISCLLETNKGIWSEICDMQSNSKASRLFALNVYGEEETLKN